MTYDRGTVGEHIPFFPLLKATDYLMKWTTCTYVCIPSVQGACEAGCEDEIFGSVDLNEDGLVDFKEFASLITSYAWSNFEALQEVMKTMKKWMCKTLLMGNKHITITIWPMCITTIKAFLFQSYLLVLFNNSVCRRNW